MHIRAFGLYVTIVLCSATNFCPEKCSATQKLREQLLYIDCPSVNPILTGSPASPSCKWTKNRKKLPNSTTYVVWPPFKKIILWYICNSKTTVLLSKSKQWLFRLSCISITLIYYLYGLTSFSIKRPISEFHRVLVGKSEVKRPLGKPRRKWEDTIMTDLQEVGWTGSSWLRIGTGVGICECGN
jgi:hypothetical protein